MKTTRFNTFETNSSNTHNLIIMTPEQMEKLDTDYFIFDDEIITKEEAEEIWDELIITSENDYPEDFIYCKTREDRILVIKENYHDRPKTIEEWGGDYEIESYELKTPGGELISILVYHGYNS